MHMWKYKYLLVIKQIMQFYTTFILWMQNPGYHTDTGNVASKWFKSKQNNFAGESISEPAVL